MTALPWDAWSNSNQQRTLRKPRQGQSDNAWSPVPFVSIKQPKLLLLREQEGDFISMKPAAVHLFLVYTRVHTYFYTRKHTRICCTSQFWCSLSLRPTYPRNTEIISGGPGLDAHLWGFCSPSTRIRKPLNHTTLHCISSLQHHSSPVFHPTTQVSSQFSRISSETKTRITYLCTALV